MKVLASSSAATDHQVHRLNGGIITNPPIAQLLFEDTRFSVVWLIVRVLLGLVFFDAGLEKLGSPAWMNGGVALKGYWSNAVAVAANGKTPIAFGWYHDFIQGMLNAGAYDWFAKLIAVGEFAIGLALIIGMMTAFAAFFGGFMSWNFVMAGTASGNGLYFAAAVLLVLAWKTAGYYGVDRFLLPRLGTPWRPVQTVTHEKT